MQDIDKKVDLSTLPKVFKLFLTMFLICMGTAYLFAIANIQTHSGLSLEGVANHYNGNEELEIYPPELPELTGTSHTHMASMAFMFFLMGSIFIFTKTLPMWLKKTVLVDSFVAIFIAVGAFWAIRYLGRPWAILMVLSGMLLGLSAAFEIFVPLYEMWIKGKLPAKKSK